MKTNPEGSNGRETASAIKAVVYVLPALRWLPLMKLDGDKIVPVKP